MGAAVLGTRREEGRESRRDVLEGGMVQRPPLSLPPVGAGRRRIAWTHHAAGVMVMLVRQARAGGRAGKMSKGKIKRYLQL